MDDLDHQLLQLLTKDARASATVLARNLGVSRGTIQNRIDRLQHQNVIKRFTVELSAGKTDSQVSAFTLIRLKADDGKATIQSLRRISAILDIHTLSGSFDLVAEVRASSLSNLDTVLDSIRALPEVAETQSHIRLSSSKADNR
ncbi:transcriptional regulator, AsnC family [Litoreibacter ascidiaceicola]|uniref:Transcriptional regulator, AsnC family n=1 Tax=Litoreibacter ascidiaceicola TaxID=1486859 RepID=A0A1M4T8U8_9RHOB|nr:Lrp/AsnC family transcriptional regulator [Litoreibacter ascidiaceicola]SHE40982.1 transcriptional regulator, AsnC family [Litoreibacter ascidiaceicola]